MNIPTVLGVMLSLAASASCAATVYKWTDAAGVVHFSDQPEPGSEKIITNGGPARSAAPTTAPAPPAPQKPAVPLKPSVALGYTTLAIASPTPGQTFVATAVPVRLALDPVMKPNHILTWSLNGSALPDTEQQFALENLPRGAYSLTATISDPATQESYSTDPVDFFVRQPSILAPLAPKK